jgi:cytochrome c biogenesis protein CcdA
MMTFIFFLGILVVFIPLGLGFGIVGKLINQFHDWIYFIGGLFLVLLGASVLSGKHYALPFFLSPQIKNYNIPSIFVLGIFSGLATTCCAPVLAGVLALSVLPGSVFWGGMYSFAYVLGMTVPLFIIALFLDKIDFTKKFGIFQKAVNYKLLGREISVSAAGLVSGLMFVAMGILILILLATGNLRMTSHYQTIINIYTAKATGIISGFWGQVPAFVSPLFLIILFLIIIKITFHKKPG